MKALVTGGSGFIGGHLSQMLEKKGYDVTIIDMRKPNFPFDGLVLKHDISMPICCIGAVNFDVVFHCAGMLGTDKLFDFTAKAELVNVIGSINLFEWAIKKNARDHHPVVVQPNLLGLWLNPYMLSKNQAERYGFMYAEQHGLRYISIKPTDVYGPRQHWKDNKAAPIFILNALQDIDISIHGDGTAWVNYIFVKDVARLMISAFENKAIGKTLCLSHPDNNMGIEEFANQVIKYTGSKSNIVYVPMRRGQPYIVNQIEHNTTETWKYIDKESLTSLKDGLIQTIDWYKGLL